MLTRIRTCLLTAALVLAAGCDLGPTEPEPIDALPRALTDAEAELVDAGNSFAFDLLREVHRLAAPDSNVFLSPLSASMALGMALNGADGETFDSMRAGLGLGELDLDRINDSYASLIDLLTGLDPSIEVGVANAAWPREGFAFEDAYLTTVEETFDAHVQPLDFGDPGAPGVINAWVDERTNGRIPELLDRIDPNEVLFLVNAVYFDASWVHRFDPDDTRDASFRRPDGSETTVRMMTRDGPVRIYRDTLLTAADLPYGGGAYSMTVLVPNGDRSLDALVDALDADRWAEVVAGLREEDDGKISLPTFRLEYGTSLVDALEALGMGIAFDESRADFTRMYAPGGLYISRVDQKTFLEVDEEGTEAAAATNTGVGLVSAPPHIRVDRPFVLAIRERYSGTVLFIGTIADPTLDS